jgi:hypothetical protein
MGARSGDMTRAAPSAPASRSGLTGAPVRRAVIPASPGKFPSAEAPTAVSSMVARLPGDVIARGTRSVVHAYGRGAVVKVPAASTVDRWITFEAQYAEAARACGAPVPRLLGIEQIGGRPASVWERVFGVSMWQQVVDRPRRNVELGVALADVQLALFDLVPPVTLPAQRDRLVAKIRCAAATIEPQLARALDFLPPASSATRLCHGDMHPSNVLLSLDGPMVVDWFDASRGDAVADVARSSLLLMGNEMQAPAHLPGADPATLVAFNRSYLGRLTEQLGIEPAALARWHAVNAVARIAEGVPCGPLLELWNHFERSGSAYAVSG